MDMWMAEIMRQWRMRKRCRSCWADSEKRALWERENANLPLFIPKRCVSTICTSAKTGFRWKRQKKKHCPWTKRKKGGRGVREREVRTKIYILMEKRVCSGPRSSHWFEEQSTVHLWCDAGSCLSGRVGLTWAVFILLFNEKTAAWVWKDPQLPM